MFMVVKGQFLSRQGLKQVFAHTFKEKPFAIYLIQLPKYLLIHDLGEYFLFMSFYRYLIFAGYNIVNHLMPKTNTQYREIIPSFISLNCLLK